MFSILGARVYFMMLPKVCLHELNELKNWAIISIIHLKNEVSATHASQKWPGWFFLPLCLLGSWARGGG